MLSNEENAATAVESVAATEIAAAEAAVSSEPTAEQDEAPKKKRRRRRARKPKALQYWTPEQIAEMSKRPAGDPVRPPVEIVRDMDSTHPIAIQFEHVSKEYKLYKDDMHRLACLVTGKGKPRSIFANDDLSFTIKRGEAVSFLGNNGAGKSTALKIATGVRTPSHGKVTVHGRVSALLELTAGFDKRLTGRENLAIRGYLWGLSNEEIEELTPQIIEFSELGDFIDQPLRTYSSGMKSRLGFAFASSISPDLLIVDEALSVGDRKFKRKCLDRVHDIIENDNVTVLFVTHSGSSAKEFCTRGVVLDKGHALYEGPIERAVEFHENR